MTDLKTAKSVLNKHPYFNYKLLVKVIGLDYTHCLLYSRMTVTVQQIYFYYAKK